MGLGKGEGKAVASKFVFYTHPSLALFIIIKGYGLTPNTARRRRDTCPSATVCHLPYRITVLLASQLTASKPVLELPTLEGWKAELI